MFFFGTWQLSTLQILPRYFKTLKLARTLKEIQLDVGFMDDFRLFVIGIGCKLRHFCATFESVSCTLCTWIDTCLFCGRESDNIVHRRIIGMLECSQSQNRKYECALVYKVSSISKGRFPVSA